MWRAHSVITRQCTTSDRPLEKENDTIINGYACTKDR